MSLGPKSEWQTHRGHGLNYMSGFDFLIKGREWILMAFKDISPTSNLCQFVYFLVFFYKEASIFDLFSL